jgi:hypothetical protein
MTLWEHCVMITTRCSFDLIILLRRDSARVLNSRLQTNEPMSYAYARPITYVSIQKMNSVLTILSFKIKIGISYGWNNRNE